MKVFEIDVQCLLKALSFSSPSELRDPRMQSTALMSYMTVIL